MPDINKLPTDGYIIFPLSMSRLNNGQNPKKCMQYMQMFDDKVSVAGIDIIFLYTNGLYFNTDDLSFAVRKKTNMQMLSHRNALKKLIMNKKTIPLYIPQAFHFLPFDYIMLNSDEYQPYFEKLVRVYKEDMNFKKLVDKATMSFGKTHANRYFVFEEIVVSHLIRQNMIDFPKHLVNKDTFRLIVYPGPILKADAYVLQKKILPQKNPKSVGRYYDSLYNPEEKQLYKLDQIDLD